MGSFGISDFHVRMMESSGDEELKRYFEEKLRRAKFIANAVEQRRMTVFAISKQILVHQEQFLLGHGALAPMTLEMIAAECEIHKSTVSRAIREKYILAPRGCVLVRDLFSTGISSGNDENGQVSRYEVKNKLRELVLREDKSRPCSDEQLVELLKDAGMNVSRRTVAKYRMEMGIPGAFQRRDI